MDTGIHIIYERSVVHDLFYSFCFSWPTHLLSLRIFLAMHGVAAYWSFVAMYDTLKAWGRISANANGSGQGIFFSVRLINQYFLSDS